MPSDADAPDDIFPARPDGAPTGGLFYARAVDLSPPDRERMIRDEILSGNVPAAVRALHEVTIRAPASSAAASRSATLRVTGDYLAVGSDDDFLRVPLSPLTAQAIADALGCLLPTKKIVDEVYAASQQQIAIPIPPPGREMMLMPRFRQHNTLVDQHLVGSFGDLLAGHKKDVVVTRRLQEIPQRVAIYGFFRANKVPWQPLELPHEDTYADYSHGIRLVIDTVTLDDGTTMTLTDLLADATLCALASEEGVIDHPRYRIPAA